MTDLPANLNMAGLLAFLHKTYGAEPLKQTLRQINGLTVMERSLALSANRKPSKN